MDLFDVIGPVMVGPSSSHTAGAARIGKITRRLLGCRPVCAKIGLYGSFQKTYLGHGTDKALIGGLLGMNVDDLRLRNSLEIARQEGLEYSFYPAELRHAHPGRGRGRRAAFDRSGFVCRRWGNSRQCH